jgi:cullin-associated NEDD8-dissociated protein 1
MSWKIRKAAAKLLTALFCTRTDYLADFYANAASVLVLRFKERVESVRVEVISAFTSLINQSGLVMDHRRKRIIRKPSSLVPVQSAKKRRSESGSIETATSPHR